MRFNRVAAIVLLLCATVARGDEGMWLPDHPPVELLKQALQLRAHAAVARARPPQRGEHRRVRVVRLARRDWC
jgi:hypothetical protein